MSEVHPVNTCARAALGYGPITKKSAARTAATTSTETATITTKQTGTSNETIAEDIAALLPLRGAWSDLHATQQVRRREQQDFHMDNLTTITQIMEATILELRDKFPSVDLPNSGVLNPTMLKLITDNGKNPQLLVTFLQNLGVVGDSVLCRRHTPAVPMVLENRTRKGTTTFAWRCYHRIEGKKCGASQTLFKDTIFDNCKVPIMDKLTVILHILQHHSNEDIVNQVNVNLSTIAEWRKECRECFRNYGKLMRRIGGQGTVVEIDETHIGERKYNVGGRVQQRMVLGGIERNSGRFFMVQIPNNSAMTLSSTILQFVAPGGTVITYQHERRYSALSTLGYNHQVVCRRTNLVNSEDQDACIDIIEGKWSLLKRFLRMYASNCPTVSLQHLLEEYMFFNDCLIENVDPSLKFLALLRGERLSNL